MQYLKPELGMVGRATALVLGKDEPNTPDSATTRTSPNPEMLGLDD